MAIAMIAPFAGQRVIEIPARERLIGRKQVNDLHQKLVEPLAENARFFPSVIALEAVRVFNRPHSVS